MKTRRGYLLTLLTVILAFNYTDRFAFGLVAQDVQSALHLTDTQLGVLSGIAFALFYALMGIPIARRADRGNRISIIWMSTACWSIAVAVCGLVKSFYQLLLVRIVVGVGESGCVPPALSLIADTYSRSERPRAVSIYMQGIAASMVIGYFVAGWLNQLLGWRMMFALIGLPGLLLATLAAVSLRDPRNQEGSNSVKRPETPELTAVLRELFASRSFRHLLIANSILWLISFGTQQWTPVFFVREFGMQTGVLGTWLAAIYGLGGIVGTFLGGEWASRPSMRGERRQLRWMALVTAGSAILIAIMFVPWLAPSAHVAMLWLALGNLLGVMTNGPLFALIQTLVPPRMRAMSVALVFFFGNLIGMGLGPWAAGALSDTLRPWAGQESLRYALLALCPGFLWSAWHLWAAGATIGKELALIEQEGIESDPTAMINAPENANDK